MSVCVGVWVCVCKYVCLCVCVFVCVANDRLQDVETEDTTTLAVQVRVRAIE